MKGKILDYSFQQNSGVIAGDDGNRYTFENHDWKGEGLPSRGMNIDFTTEGSIAREIYLSLDSPAGVSGEKSKIAAGLLAIFLGGLGIHKFYLGFTAQGLIFLLTNTIGWVVTIFLLGLNIILGIIALIGILPTKTDQELNNLRYYANGFKQRGEILIYSNALTHSVSFLEEPPLPRP